MGTFLSVKRLFLLQEPLSFSANTALYLLILADILMTYYRVMALLISRLELQFLH